MLTSLAFVPTEDVVTVFEKLLDSQYFRDNEDTLLPIINYMEDVWVGRLDRRGERRQPMFSHDIWNLYSSVKDGLPKTNNAIEGWHTAFSSMIATSHASIFNFIDAIKKDEVLTNYKLQESECGDSGSLGKSLHSEEGESYC